MPLTEERRTQLDGIVQQMVQNKEPDENIQWVVNDFKQKYEPPTTPVPPEEKTIGGFAANIPKSGIEFGKNIFSAAIHPIDTIKNIAGLPRGVGHLIAEQLGAALSPEEKGYADQVRGLGNLLADRYGGWEKIKNTAYNDPVGLAADLSTILSGVGGAMKVAGVKGAATTLKLSELSNPIAWGGDAVSGIRQLISKTNLPESLYARALKIPPGSLRAEQRAKVLNTLVENERLPLGKATRAKINSTIREIEGKVQPILDDLSQQGVTVDATAISNTLDNLKDIYANRPKPEKYYNVIDRVKTDFLNHAYNNGGQISLSDAMALKKGTYAELEEFYNKIKKPETGRVGIKTDVEAAAKAKAASTLREAILNSPDVPADVKVALNREAGLMNARKWVERAVNRGQNLDPAGLGSMAFGILVEGGVPGAVAYRIAVSQPVQSRLALLMAHGSKTLQWLSPITRPTGLGLSQAEKYIGLTPQPTQE